MSTWKLESSDGERVEIDTDEGPESEILIESPEMPTARSQIDLEKPKKRKLKKEKFLQVVYKPKG